MNPNPLINPVVEITDKLLKMGYSTMSISQWIKMPNYQFGGVSPQQLIDIGKSDKVLKFIENAKLGEWP